MGLALLDETRRAEWNHVCERDNLFVMSVKVSLFLLKARPFCVSAEWRTISYSVIRHTTHVSAILLHIVKVSLCHDPVQHIHNS
jgi:hypothetical protein